MRIFTRVVETGGFSAAAKAEGIAQPTVSKEIAALEKHLHASLLQRNSRGLSVTAQGQDYYQFAVGMLADLDAAEAGVRSSGSHPQGRIRVTCAPVIASRLIIPRLPEFLGLYPDVTIDLDVSERFVSLVEEGMDLAIRVGDLSASGLLARRIGTVRPVTVAAPAYLERHGVPQTPADLAGHQCLPFLFEGVSKGWWFKNTTGDITIAPTASLRSNDAESLQAAVRAGLGIVQGPRWIFADEIAAGTLVSILPEWRANGFPIHTIRSATRRMASGIKLFADFVAVLVAHEAGLEI